MEEISILPQDVIIEILIRLPIKTLLKFSSVSKSWLYLLSNTEFHKTHINFSINNHKITDYTLAALATVSGLGKICHVYTISTEKSSITVAKHVYPPKTLSLSAWLLGSCNGLICLTTDSFNLMLLNPCTGKFNVFSDLMMEYEVGDGGCYIRYGFGYDASTQDYKVVKIFSFPRIDDEGRHVNMVSVYSLKANLWSAIQGFNSGYINGNVGVFVNGVLHWEGCYNHISGGDSSEIVTLDLATERYGRITLPSYEVGGVHWTLSESRGRLVACCNYELNKADIWVMKEYGVEESWIKLVTISSPDDCRVNISPLFVAENGDEVLVKVGTELTLYNSRNASFKRIADYVSDDDFLQLQVATYLESLTSPHI